MATTRQDQMNWSGYEVMHMRWNDYNEFQQELIDAVWQGSNNPPIGLEEITENSWWHNFMTSVPILVFNLQVYQGKDKGLLPMRVFLDESGGGLAVSWEYNYKGDAAPKYYRVGCHHQWLEISCTRGGLHVYRCSVCNRVQEIDSSG